MEAGLLLVVELGMKIEGLTSEHWILKTQGLLLAAAPRDGDRRDSHGKCLHCQARALWKGAGQNVTSNSIYKDKSFLLIVDIASLHDGV